jgi:hypothetical protein
MSSPTRNEPTWTEPESPLPTPKTTFPSSTGKRAGAKRSQRGLIVVESIVCELGHVGHQQRDERPRQTKPLRRLLHAEEELVSGEQWVACWTTNKPKACGGKRSRITPEQSDECPRQMKPTSKVSRTSRGPPCDDPQA